MDLSSPDYDNDHTYHYDHDDDDDDDHNGDYDRDGNHDDEILKHICQSSTKHLNTVISNDVFTLSRNICMLSICAVCYRSSYPEKQGPVSI